MDNTLFDRIREANDIIEVIGGYIPLTHKSGPNYSALCPFHQEKTPSFNVNREKQIFKCFGCGKAGNVITFVRDFEHLNFVDAAKQLAARAHIDWPAPVKRTGGDKFELLQQAYVAAGEFYYQQLQAHNGQMAKTYLQERGISPQTAQKFSLGWAPEGYRNLHSHLVKQGFKDEILAESGMVNRNERGWYDLFRERLMFPIHSFSGRVVAFGGRLLVEREHQGKYVNSPTTPLYTKGNELYGLYLTRQDMARADQAIICEGYLDFLRLYEHGFINTAAALGTALTPRQINLVQRYTNNFVMLLDGDNAGQRAALKAGAEIIRQGGKVKIALLPADEDPDSFLLKHSADELVNVIGKADGFVPFYFKQPGRISPEKKLETLVQLAGEMNDDLAARYFIKEVAEVFSVAEKTLLQKVTVKGDNSGPVQWAKTGNVEEKLLLKRLLGNPTEWNEVADELTEGYFLNEANRGLYKNWYECYVKDNTMNAAMLMERLEEKNAALAAEILLDETPTMSLYDLMMQLKARLWQKRLQDIEAALRQSNVPDDETARLLKEKASLKHELFSFSGKITFKL